MTLHVPSLSTDVQSAPQVSFGPYRTFLKRTIDKQQETIEKLKTELEIMHDENDEMKELRRQEIAEITNACEATLLHEVELLSELEEKENEIQDWNANTTGLRNLIGTSRTVISNASAFSWTALKAPLYLKG